MILAMLLLSLAALVPEAAAQERRVVDLTHELSEETPVFPGGVPFQKEEVAGFETAGYLAHRLTMGEHTGTHMDAPGHFIQGGAAIADLPAEQLMAPGIVIAVERKADKDPDYALDRRQILNWEASHGGRIPAGVVVLVRTGWGSRWPDEAAYRNADEEGVMHFPGVSAQAAELLAKRGAAGVGIDTLSVDPGQSADFQAHRALAAAGLFVIENLAGLEGLPDSGFTLVVAPLKIRGGSGAPARVLAILED